MTRALPLTSPAAETALLRSATERLLTTITTLDDAAVAGPSLLPGWTRGHVLAHLARNADALVNALAGEPMYPSETARDADIERDAGRPLAAHLEDFKRTAARLDGAFAVQSDNDWQRVLKMRNGVSEPAYSLPFRRWDEVELHHIDLGTGYGIDHLPSAFVERALTYFAGRFSDHPDLESHLELRTEDGTSRHTGAAPGTARETVVIAGAPSALVGWLTGRGTGAGLSASSSLPTLPTL
jgi:maleylpyruvate isomerase